MPAGDRQRTWFPEMVEALRAEWRAEMSWDDLIALRDRLDGMLQHIRADRRGPSGASGGHRGRTQDRGAPRNDSRRHDGSVSRLPQPHRTAASPAGSPSAALSTVTATT